MPVGTVINWQDTTHHIPTNIQPLCMVRHACALEYIHNTAFAKDFQKLLFVFLSVCLRLSFACNSA